MLNDQTTAEIRKAINGEYHVSDTKTAPGFTFCLDAVFYYEGGLQENGAGVLDFYNKALREIGDPKYYLVDEKGRFKKVRKPDLARLPVWVEANKSGPDEKRKFYGLCLETGDIGGGFTDCAYQTSNTDEHSSYSRLVLPIEYLIEHGPTRFIELVLDLSANLDFSAALPGFLSTNRGIDRWRSTWLSPARAFRASASPIQIILRRWSRDFQTISIPALRG